MLVKYKDKYKNLAKPLKASLWYTISSILRKGIVFITVPIFTRLLTTAQYGQYNVYISWLEIVAIFTSLNIHSNACNNGMIKYEQSRDKFISSLQGLTTVITIVLLFIYLLFNNKFNIFFNLPTYLVIIMFIELLFRPALEMWSAKQRFDFEYKKLIMITMIMTIANPIIGIIAVLASTDKGMARIISASVTNMIFCIFIYCHNFSKGKCFYNRASWHYALVFAIPLIPHYLSQTLLNQMDRIMISSMCGSDKAGLYSVAYSAAMVLYVINTSINSALTPWIYKKIHANQIQNIREITKHVVLFVGLINMALICFAPEVMKIVAPVEYYESFRVIPSVAASVFFLFLYSLFCTIEFYYEQNKIMMIVSVLSAALNFVLNYLYIPKFGYIAAGYTTLVCFICFSIVHYFVMIRICKNKGIESIYDNKFLVVFSVIVIIFSIFISTIYNYTILRYILLSILAVVAFVKRRTIIEKIKDIGEGK